MAILDKVKKSLGITGNYQNDTLNEYIDEVTNYIIDAGVPKELAGSEVAAGVISRGVSDLWNYGSGKLSGYFIQRVTQLVYAVESGKYIIFSAGDYGITYPVNIDGIEITATDTLVFKCGSLTKTLTGITDNVALITFTSTESAGLTAGTYKWTLKLTKDTAAVTVVNDGVLIVA